MMLKLNNIFMIGLVQYIWGVVPADTGFHLDPDDDSDIVLDPSFEPGLEESQRYLLDFCQNQTTFYRTPDNYTCVMTAFDSWLDEQSLAENSTEEYNTNCEGATSVPVPSNVFDSCIISFSKVTQNKDILHDEQLVKSLSIFVKSNTTIFSLFDEQAREFSHIESLYSSERLGAPQGVDNFFWASHGE